MGNDRMSKKAFDKIAAGLNEALEIAKGNAKPSQLYVPAEINVKGIRKKLKLSQADFAIEFGFSIHQIRDWEQGRSRPLDGLRAYLMIIERNPQAVLELLKTARLYARPRRREAKGLDRQLPSRRWHKTPAVQGRPPLITTVPYGS